MIKPITRVHRNVHVIELTEKQEFLLISDLHWDNPKCNRDLLKSHLDEALKRKAIIILNGDTLCLMQGRFDPRGTKKDVRPEHNKVNYLDLVIEDCANYLAPYAHNIAVVGYGNHECYDDQTEVLTSEGWKYFDDLNKTETIATLNLSDNTVEWQKPSHYSETFYEGKMHSVGSRGANFVVTPNHKIIYQKQRQNTYSEIKSEQLKYTIGSSLTIPVSGNSLNKEYAISDDELRILAWVYTDGSVNHEKKPTVRIYQSKDIKPIIDILDRLGYEYNIQERERTTDSICGKELINKTSIQHTIYINGKGKEFILDKIKDKTRLSTFIKHELSDRQFEVFLNSYIDGDGSRHKSALSSMMAYGNKPILEDLQIACVTHGYKAYLAVYREINYRLNITKHQSYTIQNVGRYFKEIDYLGMVYCLTVPNGNMFVRRNGMVCVSGNTNIIKRLETDPLQRMVDLINYKTGAGVQAGGYGGWVVAKFQLSGEGGRVSYKIKYFHGSGGGGPVTKNTIGHQRLDAMVNDADMIWVGHTHDLWSMSIEVETLSHMYVPRLKIVTHVQTGTYKDEYNDGYGGWHIERGGPPKSLGGYWLTLEPYRERGDGKDTKKLYASVTKTKG
jgi:hypothetical protein